MVTAKDQDLFTVLDVVDRPSTDHVLLITTCLGESSLTVAGRASTITINSFGLHGTDKFRNSFEFRDFFPMSPDFKIGGSLLVILWK